MKSTKNKELQKPKSTDIVRKDFIRYLREDFVHKKSWTHPTTNEVYTHENIHKVLVRYKSIFHSNHAALVCLWLNIPRPDVATRFLISQSTLKRRWEQAVKDVLFLLFFPELIPEDLKIY